MKTLKPSRLLATTVDNVVTRFYIATFIYTLAQAIATPIIPELMDLSFHATLGFIGVVMGIYGAMQIFLRLPMGDMADRRGRKPSLILSFACTLASAFFFAFAQNAWWTIPGVILLGFSGGIFWVAANSYLFDRVATSEVPRTTSDYTVAILSAFLVGPPIGHLIAEHYGFQAAFITYFFTTLVGLGVILTLPETPPKPKPRATTSPYHRAAILLKHPALAFSAFGTFLYSVLFSTWNSFLQLHILSIGLSIAVVGFLLGGRQASAIGIRVGLPAMLARFGPVKVLFLGVVTTALATAAVPFATTLPTLVTLILVGGAATGLMIPANLMLVHRGAPVEQRGLANGIYGTMLGIGSAVAPPAFGFLGSRLGLPWAFWGAAIVALALAAVLATQTRRVEDHAAYAAAP